jgi:glycine C-acetyltransferase
VQERLEGLEKSNLYRRLKTTVVNGPTAAVNGKNVVHLCSNDYLGLSQDRRVVQAAAGALRQVSQCSSRLIAGNDPIMAELEGMLAEHRRTEAALVYPTGYSASLGAITAVADKDCTIFSDELNHASIIDGCRLSGAQIKVFRHNDTMHLEQLMKGSAAGRKIVVTEGVFSMDGDSANTREVDRIAKEHDAITVVDDAHGDFIFGPSFSGVPARFKVEADIHLSSISKGLGCFGGYVAASEKIRELLINTSRQFIYTSALPDHLCAAAIAAIPVAKKGTMQKKLFQNVRYFKSRVASLGFSLGSSDSQIMPVMIGDEKKAVAFSDALLKAGAFAQAVRYPTVKKGSARLRVSLTAMHDKDHLDAAIDAFEIAGKKSGII